MIRSTEQRVFFVRLPPPEQEGLNIRLIRSVIVPEYFNTIAHCRQTLNVKSCHLLVVNLNGNAVDGLELLSHAEPTLIHIPKLALVDQGDIATAVKAIRAGAINCLEEPVEAERLLTEVRTLLYDHRPLKGSLTPTETTVLHLLLQGKTNLQAAQALHRSPRTIEVHRSHIMRKLGVSNMVDLVKTATSMGHFRLSELNPCTSEYSTKRPIEDGNDFLA